MNLSIKKYLKECRRLFPISGFNQEFYKNILFNLNRPLQVFDNDVHVVGISTPEYRNMIVQLDKCYIVLDFNLMELFIELSYVYKNDDWGRYEYLYYTLSQEAELEKGDIDKLLFYGALSQTLYDKEKEHIIDNSRNLLHVLLSIYFVTYHEFFHYQEKQYPHSSEYYFLLQKYIESSKFESKFTSNEIAKEVICDTEAIIQLLHTGIGLEDGFISKEIIFEMSIDTLIMMAVAQLLLKRLNSVNEISFRITSALGWISTYMCQDEVFQGMNYMPIIDTAADKISIFTKHALKIALSEKEKQVLIPDLSTKEQLELLNVFLQKRNGVIVMA